MQLVQIWNSTPAWRHLSQIRKTPKVAYRLRKYQQLVQGEIDVCEKQRQAIVRELTHTGPDDVVAFIDDAHPVYAELLAQFNAFLHEESDMEPVGMSMDELIDVVDQAGNTLSELDIAQLEPFFVVAKPALELVRNTQ